MSYVLGVDGGNTKTDYLLHSMDGTLIFKIRAGTASHEKLGLQGAQQELEKQVGIVLDKVGITPNDVSAAVFGLAGIDQPFQQAQLAEIVLQLGFHNSLAINDCFLGIKAAFADGIGICSVNGTGTNAAGIDKNGQCLQLGGLGYITGDDNGGSSVAGRVLRAVYDEAFLFGAETSLTPMIYRCFGITTKQELLLAYSTKYQYGTEVTHLDLIQILFAASSEGDPIARNIVIHLADSMARACAGCVREMTFPEIINIVLIGSIWAKGRHQPMIDAFKERFEAYAKRRFSLSILSVPPAAGSVLWAMQLANGGQTASEEVRARVFEQLADCL